MIICFFDLETTSKAPESGQILSYSFSKHDFNSLELISELDGGIRPNFTKKIWDWRFKEAELIHGLSYEDCLEFPPIEDSFPQIKEFLTDVDILCAHANWWSFGKSGYFDMQFLKMLWMDMGEKWGEVGEMSTHTYAKLLASHDLIHPDGFRLDQLCEYFGIKIDSYHEAKSDRRALFKLYEKLRGTILVGVERYCVKEDKRARERLRHFRMASQNKGRKSDASIQSDLFA